MDFFAHQDRARRNTVWLIFYFALTVITIVLTVYLALQTILIFSTPARAEPFHLQKLWNPPLLFGVLGLVGTVIGLGSLYKIITLGSDGSIVATQLGGVKILPNTRNLDERILLNVVEEMAIASGTPVPPVYLLPEESGINAFAAGTTPQNAVIGVTRGCMETLSRDELQGVIAHEFSHIQNGDMKLNLRLMGLLHGILLIAMIGYFLFRIASHMPVRMSSSKDDDAKGALAFLAALFAIGGALVGIGYAGVFFASLIQSAVSRQREFLADASAVQFTRNTNGIVDALKRIGGWKSKSVMKSVYAKEASHMFFGQSSLSSWFATHPPLPERIQRLEPTFLGSFTPTVAAVHRESDVRDPRTLGFQRGSGATANATTRSPDSDAAGQSSAAHQAALQGVDHFEQHPVDAVEHVGQPEEEHIEHAQNLIAEIDPVLVESVHEPLGAVAVVFALLLAPQRDPARSRQLTILKKYYPNGLAPMVEKTTQKTDALEVELRLPLACMALPALDQLSDSQSGTLRTAVRQVIEADQQWTIFEYALQRFITRRLVLRKQESSERLIKDRQLLAQPFQIVLSTLAHLGGNVHAESAYEKGWQSWKNGPSPLPICSRDACTLKSLDRSLDRLANASGHAKRGMLLAFSECIAADGRATINEIELLRVISDALDCPMPPVLDLPSPKTVS